MATVQSWLRGLVFACSIALVGASALALYVDGHVPAAVPAEAPDYTTDDLRLALSALDSTGRVRRSVLETHRAALERFIAAMAKTAPSTTPARFPTPEDRVAFWLNATHALTLQQLLDAPQATHAAALSTWRSWPIGGQRLSRAAIERRYLSQTGDGRVWLALFDGSNAGGILSGEPFTGAQLNAQLDEAARRVLRRPTGFVLDGQTARLSTRVMAHQEDFLAALPAGRSGVLQIIWAYLPDACEGLRPGCDTRADLDRRCGRTFERCSVEPLPADDSLAATP